MLACHRTFPPFMKQYPTYHLSHQHPQVIQKFAVAVIAADLGALGASCSVLQKRRAALNPYIMQAETLNVRSIQQWDLFQ